MEDDYVVVYYDINKDSILHLVVRLPGAGYVGEEVDINGNFQRFWEHLQHCKSTVKEHKIDVDYYMRKMTWWDQWKNMLFKEINIDGNLDEDWIQIIEINLFQSA